MAAQKYFEDVIEQYFEKNKFVIQSFDEMASLENLKFLMEKIIKKEEENDKQVNEVEKRNLPTSHFMVSNALCRLLDSLELNNYYANFSHFYEWGCKEIIYCYCIIKLSQSTVLYKVPDF